jgi:endonuclease V-like protein UPF0215 family
LDVLSNSGNQVVSKISNKVRKETEKPLKVVLEKTPSLKDTLNKINTINNKENSEDNENVNLTNQSNKEIEQLEPINIEVLKEQYDIYIAKIKGKQTRLYSTLKHKTPKIHSNTEISLDFQNKAILDEFVSRVKPGLLSFLREALNNSFIDLKENLAEIENVEKPTLVSDNERLKSMADKNPALLKLKNKFNLDFD